MAEKDTITTKFRVDVSEFKSGITEANKQIKLANAQFKSASAGMDDWTKSSDGLNAKLKQLGTLLDQEKSKLKNYNDQITAQQNAYKENGKRVDELKAKLQQLTNQGVSKTSTEYKQLQKALNDCEKEQISNQKEIDKLTITMTNQQGTVNKLEKDIRNYNTQLKNLDNNQEEVNDSIKNMSEGFTTAKVVLANLISDGIRRAADVMKELATQTIEVGKSFDSAMSKVGAVSGATADELEQLRDKAKEMGSTTKFTASEAAEAFNYMAMAGWKTEDMLNGIEGILNLAASSGSDLATASDIVTDALTGMGYGAKDAGRLANVMAAAASNANTNVEMMGETFKYVTPVAGAMGYSMEDIAVSIGLMANSGIKASQAGTSLRSILQRLATDTNGARSSIEALGVKVVNTDGSMRPLNEVIVDMRKAFAGLSQEEQIATAKTVAGTEAMSGLLAIVNATETDFNKLTSAVNNSSGAAEDMAKTMQDNLGGDMTKLSSQIEGIQLQLYEKFEPTLRKTINSISKNLESVNWDAFGKKVEKAFDKALEGFEWIINHKNQVAGAMKLMIAAFVVAKINKWTKSMSEVVIGFGNLITNAKKSTIEVNKNTAAQVGNTTAQVAGTTATKGLTIATNLLNTAWKSNPIGLVVTAATALFAIYQKLKGKTSELTEAEKAQKQALEEQTSRINDNKEAWDTLKESKQQQINTGMTEISYLQNLYNELTNIVDANGKVKDGYEKRADFIVSTLNEALGTEISITDGVINKYGELTESIDKVIEKKKAQILLDAQEELYKQAIDGQASATKELNDINKRRNEISQERKDIDNEIIKLQQELDSNARHMTVSELQRKTKEITKLKEKQKELNNETSTLDNNYKTQQSLLQEYAYNMGVYEQNMALAHEGKYNEMSNVTWDYVKDYQNAEDAKAAMLQSSIEQEQIWLETLKGMRNESNKDQIDGLIATAETKLANLQNEMSQYQSTTKTGLDNVEGDWKTSLGNQLTEITGKQIEFKYAGNGLVQKYVDGVAEGEPTTRKEAEELAKATIEEINKQKGEAETAGENLVEGVGTGIENSKKQESVFSKVWNFGKKVLGKLKSAFDEHSPSKETNKMGQYLLQGLGIGIEKQENPILKQVEDFGKSVISTLNNELDSDIGSNLTSRLNGLKNGIATSTNGIRSNLDNMSTVNNSSSTTSNVNNFTQNIYAPKQPSRIELYRQTRNLLNYVKKEG